MRILICADMEGITGVVDVNHCMPGHAEYKRFQKLMTRDINAVVEGLLETGEHEIFVVDGHAYSRNILIEELHPAAELNTGSPSPLNMMDGIDQNIDAACLIGYHPRAGTEKGVLAHTWSGKAVQNVWLNGRVVGEIGLNAALAGHYDVPVIMISSDEAGCKEAAEWIPGIHQSVVKFGTGHLSAKCFGLRETKKIIKNTAISAVNDLVSNGTLKPLKVSLPVEVKIEFKREYMVDVVGTIDGVDRLDGRTISYTCKTMLEAYNTFAAAVGMAG